MIETNKIYQIDCLELIKSIPDESLDVVITDPPYGDGIGYGRNDKTILNNEDETINYRFLEVIYPKLKQNKTCYLFSNWKFEKNLRNFIEKEYERNGGGVL